MSADSVRKNQDPVIVWSRFNRGVAVAAWLLSAVIAVSLLITPDVRYWVALTVPVAVSVLAWAIYWNPRVVVDDRAVHLVNASRTITIPWEAVTGVTTQYALTIATDQRRYSATGAPAPGAYGTYAANRELSRAARASDPGAASYRPHGELDGTDSGDAFAVVHQHWEAWSKAGGRRDSRTTTVRWHTSVLVAASATTVAGVIALFLLP